MNALEQAFLLRRAELRRPVEPEAEASAEALMAEGLANRVSTFLRRDRLELTRAGCTELLRFQHAGNPALRAVAQGALDDVPYRVFTQLLESDSVDACLEKQRRLQELALMSQFWRGHGGII